MENAPFSIQPSIEEPFEGWQDWDQSMPPPNVQPRYSTAWSDRPQSLAASVAADLPPPARRIAAGRLPATATSSAPHSEATRKKKPKHLSEEDRTIIFRLAVKAGDVYGRISNKLFWEKVASSFKEATGKEHTTLARATQEIVKARRETLAQERTGEEDPPTSLTDAIDKWISIVDARNNLEQARREAQGTRDSETQASIDWRNRQLLNFSDKSQLELIARGRKRRRNSEPNNEEGGSEGSGSEADSGERGGGEDSTEVSTPISQESGGGRRRRRRRKTPRNSSPSDELPRHIGRLVDILEAKNTRTKALDSVDELKAKFNGLEEKMNNLEAGVSNILSILSRNQSK